MSKFFKLASFGRRNHYLTTTNRGSHKVLESPVSIKRSYIISADSTTTQVLNNFIKGIVVH